MKKIPYQFILSSIAILACLAWLAYPNRNLEPLIVLLLVGVSLVPIYWLEFGPWLDGFKIRRCKFVLLESKHKINAIEGDYKKFCDGVNLTLKRQRCENYPVCVKVFFEQTALRVVAYFRNGEKVDIRPNIDIGYEEGEEIRFPKQTNEYALAQFDIDNDSIDEILLCIVDVEDFQKSMQVCVLKYHPPYFYSDVSRMGNWKMFEGVVAYGVHQDKISIDTGSITIRRNFRDFVYKWDFVDGCLRYTGTA